MLTFQMDVLAADVVERTIEGVIVPYNEVGRIGRADYRFKPGSLRLARSRTPLLIDHDRGRPVGILAELRETPTGALGRFRVDATLAGDEALAQAASGSRGGLSVGAEVEASNEVDGVVEVTAGSVLEVSLVAIGAFGGANVHRVAAELEEPEPDPEPEEPEPDEEPEPEPEPEQEPAMTPQASAAPPMILAAADRPPRELLAGELVTVLVRAQHGDAEARRYIEGVLTETISTDVSGLLPPQYERTVLGGKTIPRVLYQIFGGRPLPGVGLAINKPTWTTRPDGAWAASVDADATSNKVVVGATGANVERWDWAGAIPWVVVQRSDPSIVDEIYAEAVQDFYSDVEERIAELLATAATNPADSLGAGIGAFFDENDVAPDVMVVAPDVWGTLADAGALQNPVAAGGVSTSGALTSSFGGIPIAASGKLAAGSRYLATRRALDVRVTEPVRLTANAIGALNVELAVVGEAIFDVDYADEVLELTPVVGGALAAQATRSRGGKAS